MVDLLVFLQTTTCSWYLDTSTTSTAMADSDSHGGWKAYEYYPSMAAAVIFILLFIVVNLLHTYHLIRTRTWFFIPLVIGGWCTLSLPVTLGLAAVTDA